MGQRDGVVFAYVTHPEWEGARLLGRRLVERGLAACVNILPGMHSICTWDCAIESGQETVMIVKTTDSLRAALQDAIRDAHPYTCPCIVFIEIAGGHQAYLEWIAGAVHSPQS